MLVEAAWSAAAGRLRAFKRINARRGFQVAVVATARKMAVLYWHLVTKNEDYAFARPALNAHKRRKLELAAGAPRAHGRPATRTKKRLGYAYLHTAIDDYSRLAYTEVLADEKGRTAAAFWRRAHAWFRAWGLTVERVLTDNAFCYRGRLLNAGPGGGPDHLEVLPALPTPLVRPTARSVSIYFGAAPV
jgi:hypothetical protein